MTLNAAVSALLLDDDAQSTAFFIAHCDALSRGQPLHLMLFINQASVLTAQLERLQKIVGHRVVFPSLTHGVYRIMHRAHQSLTVYLGPFLATIQQQSHCPDYWFASHLDDAHARLLLKRSHAASLYVLAKKIPDSHYHHSCRVPPITHAWLQQAPWLKLIEAYHQPCLMADPPSFRVQHQDPWLAPWFHDQQQGPTLAAHSHALVIGAGIAGATTARSLADQGYTVTIIDAAKHVADGASGNPMGILYPNLSPHATVQTDLLCSAYPWALHTLSTLSQPNLAPIDHRTGLCDDQVWPLTAFEAFNPEFLRARHPPSESLAASAQLFFPHAAWVRPKAWINQLIQHPRITLRFNERIDALAWCSSSNQWLATSSSARHQADAIVLAHANHAAQLEQTAHLPLHAIRGQVSMVQATPQSQMDAMIHCHRSYITPAYAGEHCIGASFDPHHCSLDIRPEDTAANLAALADLRPTSYQALSVHPNNQPIITRERVSIRASTPDYLPLVGRVSPPNEFMTTYAALRQDRKLRSTQACPRWPQLYVTVGHGTRGLLTAPLAAAMITAQMSGQPLPVSRQVEEALHPNRFLWRALIKKPKL